MTHLIAMAVLGQDIVAPKNPILIVDDLAIGTWQNKWVAAEKDVKQNNPFLATELELTREGRRMRFEGLNFYEEVGGNFINSQSSTLGVYWTGGRVKYPRPITTLSPNSNSYKAIVAEALKKENPNLKIEITSLVKVDLDGDGVDEVLIDAQNVNGNHDDMFKPDKGTFSTVLLRTVVKGKGVTTPLFVSVSKGGDEGWLEKFATRAIADINGDGLYEVVVSTEYYEGSGAAVYNYSKGKLSTVLEFGAGV